MTYEKTYDRCKVKWPWWNILQPAECFVCGVGVCEVCVCVGGWVGVLTATCYSVLNAIMCLIIKATHAIMHFRNVIFWNGFTRVDCINTSLLFVRVICFILKKISMVSFVNGEMWYEKNKQNKNKNERCIAYLYTQWWTVLVRKQTFNCILWLVFTKIFPR